MCPLFPLPLTPFEYYYWCDDRPDYPVTFPVELTFSGVLEQDLFCRAVEIVVARHPLLTARVRRAGLAAPAWVEGDGQRPAVLWVPNGAPVALPQGEYIDLESEPGLRICVSADEPRMRVLLQFHHLCCDGLGAMRVVSDLLMAHHALVAGRDPVGALPPLEAERLRTRGSFDTADLPPPSLRDLWSGVRGWTKLLMQSPAPLAASDAEAPRDTRVPFPGFLTRVLDPQLVRRLTRAATSLGATFNDALLRDLFLVLRQWNAPREESDASWLRINMPTALRHREDDLAPATNALGFTFLTRRARDCDQEAELFDSIRRETEAIRRYRLGLFFLGGLAMARRVPGLIPFVLGRNRSLATVVLSNLGRVPRRLALPSRDHRYICGNAVLERIAGAPPIRPLTRAAIAVAWYGGETTLNLRYDARHWGPVEANQFLAEYVARIERTAHS